MTIEEKAIESRKYHKDESFDTFNKELTFRMDDWAYGYCQGATEQQKIDDKRIAELEKEKASLVLEIHNKNKRIAELLAR